MQFIKNRKITAPALILALFCLSLATSASLVNAQTEIDANFNPNNIISDDDLLDARSMTLSEIQNFLQSKNSYLANYITPNNSGTMKTAAEIIYDASNRNFDCDGVSLSDSPTEDEKRLKCKTITTVNPKFLMVLLQKEASLIEDTSPAQSHLDWATGYGCPDNWTCNPYYKGFGKQVNSASLQFLAYMQEPEHYGFKVGETYIAPDRYSALKSVPKAVSDGTYNQIISSPDRVTVTPENKATAALYNYTPHVFNGNYNTYKLMDRYFPESDFIASYPDGSVVKVAGDPGVWLIEKGKKRLFLNYSSFISRFSPQQIVTVSASMLSGYPTGDGIRFSNYSLVQTPDKKIYMLVGSEKRQFDSLASFKTIGFNQAEIETASSSELAGYTDGKTITATSAYVTGALLQDTKTGGVFYVENNTKAPLLDKILLATKFKGKKIVRVSTTILNKYTTVAPALFDDGTLLKTDSYPSVYLISNGKKRAFASEAVFKNLGYDMANVITISSKLMSNYPQGDPIQ
jgi:hypothetical protein